MHRKQGLYLYLSVLQLCGKLCLSNHSQSTDANPLETTDHRRRTYPRPGNHTTCFSRRKITSRTSLVCHWNLIESHDGNGIGHVTDFFHRYRWQHYSPRGHSESKTRTTGFKTSGKYFDRLPACSAAVQHRHLESIYRQTIYRQYPRRDVFPSEYNDSDDSTSSVGYRDGCQITSLAY